MDGCSTGPNEERYAMIAMVETACCSSLTRYVRNASALSRPAKLNPTSDVSTMTDFAYERIGQGLPTPGVFVIRQSLPVGQAIEELLILAECSREGEWEGTLLHLPL